MNVRDQCAATAELAVEPLADLTEEAEALFIVMILSTISLAYLSRQ